MDKTQNIKCLFGYHKYPSGSFTFYAHNSLSILVAGQRHACVECGAISPSMLVMFARELIYEKKRREYRKQEDGKKWFGLKQYWNIFKEKK